MSTPTLEQVNAALATVNDPEIKRPITELGMVDSVDIDDAGPVRAHRAADRRRLPAQGHHHPRRQRPPSATSPGVTDVDLELGRDDRRAAGRPAGVLQRRPGAAGDPVRPARLAHQGLRDRLRQGRRRQVLGHRQPRAGDGRARASRSASSTPTSTATRSPRCSASADSRPTQVDDLIMPVPTAVGRLGDLDRHAQAAPRPGRRLARPDARPGARADARPTSTGATSTCCCSTCRRAPATSRSRSASTCPAPRSSW